MPSLQFCGHHLYYCDINHISVEASRWCTQHGIAKKTSCNISYMKTSLQTNCIYLFFKVNHIITIRYTTTTCKSNENEQWQNQHNECATTLWSYYYGNLGLVIHSGVIVKLPSNYENFLLCLLRGCIVLSTTSALFCQNGDKITF